MVLKRLWALIMSVLLVASLGGCSSAQDGQTKGGPDAGTVAVDGSEAVDETSSDGAGDTVKAGGVLLQASKSSADLTITRPKPAGKRPDGVEDGSWTVFCYLCGSDLESNLSAATFNLSQMVAAMGSDKVSFVVETGGAKQWDFEDLSSKENDRLFIQDGAVTVVDSVPAKNMGDGETLADFLTWGVENYPADHMGVILWNHGGGSVGGICYDELNDDMLSLDEVDYAFGQAFGSCMWDKFDFVGCDACLMSTIEAANILASYADYYYASQEIEPSTGWDYTSIMEYLATTADANGEGLGRCVTDTYFENMEFYEVDDASSTFAVTDLSRVDALLKAFNAYARDLFDKTEDTAELSSFMRGVAQVDSFGGNNPSEGYTNMVDLKGILNVSSDTIPSAADALKALDEAVVYHREGTDHRGVGGLSVYFPLEVGDADELSAFASVCVSPYYLSFVDRQAQGKAYGDATNYSNDSIFSDDGTWNQHIGGVQLATPGQGQGNDQYWSYADEGTGEAAEFTFADEPQVTGDGTYWCRLDERSLERASMVKALLYETSADGKDFLAIGETFEVYVDWDTGKIEDAFDGLWLSLPDGQNLCAYIEDWSDEYTVFTCPIELNGENTNLHLRVYDEDYSVVVEGVWDGISESGASGRGVRELKPGDKIKPLYDAYAVEGDEESTYEGQEYTVDDSFYVAYDQLAAGDYYYEFSIEDLYGSYYITDPVIFTVDEKGDIYFDF